MDEAIHEVEVRQRDEQESTRLAMVEELGDLAPDTVLTTSSANVGANAVGEMEEHSTPRLKKGLPANEPGAGRNRGDRI